MSRRWAYAIVLGFLVLGALGLAIPYDARLDGDHALAYQPPTLDHPLGTDRRGRDLLQRLVVGTRSFFLPGLVGALIATTVGIPLGAFAGYRPSEADIFASKRGAVGRIIAGARNAVALVLAIPGALPRFVTIVLVCVSFGFEPFIIAAVAGVLYAADLGEDVKTRITSESREEYVESARADGLSLSRILGFHLLWLQCRGLVLRHVINLWVFVLMTETALSFIQTPEGGMFGVQEPDPSWGNMIVTPTRTLVRGFMAEGAEHLIAAALVPSVALVGLSVALTWAADVLTRSVAGGASDAEEPGHD